MYHLIIHSTDYLTGLPETLLSEKVLGKQFGYYEQAKIVKESRGEKKNIINVLILPHFEWFDGPYFQNRVILDPHTKPEDDPYKIIFVFEYPAKDLIDDYYYGRKKGEWFIENFKKLIQDPGMEVFMEERGAKYTFETLPEVHYYDYWLTPPNPNDNPEFFQEQ